MKAVRKESVRAKRARVRCDPSTLEGIYIVPQVCADVSRALWQAIAALPGEKATIVVMDEPGEEKRSYLRIFVQRKDRETIEHRIQLALAAIQPKQGPRRKKIPFTGCLRVRQWWH